MRCNHRADRPIICSQSDLRRRGYRGSQLTLRETIDAFCLHRIGRKPDLDNPQSYNDKIQWLKLHDQMPEHITCCSKLGVRDYVADRVGSKYLLTVLRVARSVNGLTPYYPAMVKATHDSGSAFAVTDRHGWRKACQRLARALEQPYGIAKGEWAYKYVHPLVMVERLMPGQITDYKFHCCEGRIKWVQIISERQERTPLECITDQSGAPLGLHLDHKFRSTDKAKLPGNWDLMTDIAGELSREFRYVRVDLYSSEGRVYFGELTFWPRAGTYLTKDEPTFGEMMDFDMSYKREPIWA